VRDIRRSDYWRSLRLSANVMKFAVFMATGGSDALFKFFPRVRCGCSGASPPDECDFMLLTFLLADSGPDPAAHGFASAYTLFNGRLRLRAMSLSDGGGPSVLVPAIGRRILIFRAIVSNGSPDRVMGNFDAALADDDGTTVTGRPLEDDWNLARGGAARTAAEFHVDPGFMPVKLILIDTSEPEMPAFRFDVRARFA
jgi:hypothetical protein